MDKKDDNMFKTALEQKMDEKNKELENSKPAEKSKIDLSNPSGGIEYHKSLFKDMVVKALASQGAVELAEKVNNGEINIALQTNRVAESIKAAQRADEDINEMDLFEKRAEDIAEEIIENNK